MPKIGQGRSLFDDTPVNGQIEKGISSNWAYDEDATLRALIEAALPWIITINPFHKPKSQVNWDQIYLNSSMINCGMKYSTGAQSASIAWDVLIPKGTWQLELISIKDVDRGIYTVSLDGISQGLIDGYYNTSSLNESDLITGIQITSTAKKELKLTMATKNASASSYIGAISALQLLRTA